MVDRRRLLNVLVVSVAVLVAPARALAAEPERLKPFKSDVCTGVRDRSQGGADWSHCCIAHDLAYWAGGTAKERAAADQALRRCRLDAEGHRGSARLMWLGVRVMAHPIWPVPYRWGYGWSWFRGYQPVGEAEQQQVVDRIAAFCADPAAPAAHKQVVCPPTTR